MYIIIDQGDYKEICDNTSHKQPNLEFKTRPKQLKDSLPLAFALPIVAHGDTASFPWEIERRKNIELSSFQTLS
jgi:hypothetical protein